jgi:hypothetical protein
MSDWRDQARCANLGMTDKSIFEIFYPDPGSDKSYRHLTMLHKRAKRVCARCPVRVECLTEALLHEAGRLSPHTGKWERHLPWGVWGGHTALERHAECRTAQGRHSCPPKVSEHAERLERRFTANITKLLTKAERGMDNPVTVPHRPHEEEA